MARKDAYRRRSSGHRGSDTEARILAALSDLLEAGHDFTDVSVEQIAEIACISKPNFYYHFVSKDAALRALYADKYDGLVEQLVKILEDGLAEGQTLRKMYQRYFELLATMYQENAGLIWSAKLSSQKDGEIINSNEPESPILTKVTIVLRDIIKSRANAIGHENPELAIALANISAIEILISKCCSPNSKLLQLGAHLSTEELVNELASMLIAYLRLDEDVEQELLAENSKIISL